MRKTNLQDMKGISKLSSLHIIKHSRQNKCLTPMENEAVFYNINKICDISFFHVYGFTYCELISTCLALFYYFSVVPLLVIAL